MCRPALKSDFNCSIQKAGVTFRELKRPSIHSGGDAGVNGISAKIKSYRVKYEDQGEICFLKTGCSCMHLEWSLSNLLFIKSTHLFVFQITIFIIKRNFLHDTIQNREFQLQGRGFTRHALNVSQMFTAAVFLCSFFSKQIIK